VNIRGLLNLEIDLRQSVSPMVDVLYEAAQHEESEMNLDEAILGRRARLFSGLRAVP
jgi:hypothetical protein